MMVTSNNQPCVVCREINPDNFRIWFDGYVKIYKCLSCGAVAQYSGPGSQTIVTDYSNSYNLNFLKEGKLFRRPEKENGLIDIINKITKYTSGKNLLDIGCGDGQFIHLCKKNNFQCKGIELDTNLSKYASQITGCQIINMPYHKSMFPESSFDVITLIQVLEHLTDPTEILKIAHYHLKEHGIIIIEIPSIQSPNFLAYRLTKLKFFVRPPHGVIKSHYGYYNPSTLLKLTTKCDYHTVELITGRWKYKKSKLQKLFGSFIDPLLGALKIGGILYIGTKKGFRCVK